MAGMCACVKPECGTSVQLFASLIQGCQAVWAKRLFNMILRDSLANVLMLQLQLCKMDTDRTACDCCKKTSKAFMK